MEARITEDNFTDTIKIIVYEKGFADKRIIYNAVKGEGQELSAGQPVPEHLILKLPYAALSALAVALSEMGVKTDKDAKIEGTLEATRFHLGDLRKLLKLE